MRNGVKFDFATEELSRLGIRHTFLSQEQKIKIKIRRYAQYVYVPAQWKFLFGAN